MQPSPVLPPLPTDGQSCMSSPRAAIHYEKCKYSTHEMHERASALEPLQDPTATQIPLQYLPMYSCYVSKKLQGQPRANLANMAPARTSNISRCNFADKLGIKT
jgi:hypothetical protein